MVPCDKSNSICREKANKTWHCFFLPLLLEDMLTDANKLHLFQNAEILVFHPTRYKGQTDTFLVAGTLRSETNDGKDAMLPFSIAPSGQTKFDLSDRGTTHTCTHTRIQGHCTELRPMTALHVELRVLQLVVGGWDGGLSIFQDTALRLRFVSTSSRFSWGGAVSPQDQFPPQFVRSTHFSSK